MNTDEHVYCWGRNRYGELGNDTTQNRQVRFMAVSRWSLWILNRLAHYVTRADRRSAGGASSWRFGTNQVTGNQKVPVQVGGLENVVDIDVGNTSTSAILSDQTLSCWGVNWVGQTGLPVQSPHGPTLIPDMNQAVAVELESTTGCAIAGEDAQVYCWGWNHYGQAGDPSTHRLDNGVRAVEGVTGAVGVRRSPSAVHGAPTDAAIAGRHNLVSWAQVCLPPFRFVDHVWLRAENTIQGAPEMVTLHLTSKALSLWGSNHGNLGMAQRKQPAVLRS